MYKQGQMFLWEDSAFIVDDVTKYKFENNEIRLIGKMREMKEGNQMSLNTIHIDFNKEKDNLDYIADMNEEEYLELITSTWHKDAPETRPYAVTSLEKATHVVFSSTDLLLAGQDGENFTPYKVYSIQRIEESDDLLIIDDNGEAIIGFEVFIPCEFLKPMKAAGKTKPKRTKNNVISFLDFKNRKK